MGGDAMGGDEMERGRDSLPPDVAALAEMLGERLNAGAGRWRIELSLEDGHLKKWKLQVEGGRDALARFDR